MIDGFEITGHELLSGPMELLYDELIFPGQGGIGDGICVRIDAERYARTEKTIDGMVPEAAVNICLQVAAGAYFEVNVVRCQEADERSILNASYPMPDAAGMEVIEGFPDTSWPFGLSCVGGAGDILLPGISEGCNVIVYRIAGFVGCDIKAYYMGMFKFFNQPYCHHALSGRVMPQCAEDHAYLYARLPDALFNGRIYRRHHFFRGKAFLKVLQGGKTDLGVYDVVFLQLAEEVQRYQPQGLFCLHERDAACRTSDVVAEVGATGGCDEVSFVVIQGYGRVECFYDIVAQRAVEVEVQLYFWPGGRRCRLTSSVSGYEKQRRQQCFLEVLIHIAKISVIKGKIRDICPAPSMIRKSPIFLQILDKVISGGAPRESLVIQELPPKKRLLEQDRNTRNVFVIRSGIVKCFIAEENGKEYILEFLGEGEILGEIEAIRKTAGMAMVESLTSLCVFKIEKAFFLQLLKTDAVFNQAVLELMATRVANTAMRASRQQLYTLSYNLSQLLKILHQGEIAFTKKDLSDYLGISIRSLNRLLKES